MAAPQILEWLIVGIVCLLCAGSAVFLLSPRKAGFATGSAWLTRLRRNAPGRGPAVWLFDGDRLLDTNQAAFVTRSQDAPSDWEAFRKSILERFPGFPEAQPQLASAGRLRIPAEPQGDGGEIRIENFDGLVRIELSDGPEAQITLLRAQKYGIDRHSAAVERSPYPIWRVDRDGNVLWSNPAYDRLEKAIMSETVDEAHPAVPIFRIPSDYLLQGKTRRIPVSHGNSDSRQWFDVEIVPDDEGALCYAVNIDAVVDAENAQRNFVQTLAKTFAQLSIGLAIFDRNRQLALFNPALIDLTSLPAEFLSGRPNLLTFFDRLRDNNMMPEPKDYKSWRHQMAELVAAATDGRYHETWTLPSGSVYSISGRPHPDGAIAFLFEDITAEISLTRRFRSDLELGQSVFDQLDDAIAVFASDGSLALTNLAYRQMWGVDPDKSFVQMSVIDATRTWQEKCRATPLWGEIRDFVASRENRAEWRGDVQMSNGDPVMCRVTPLQNGATMVMFSHELAITVSVKEPATDA